MGAPLDAVRAALFVDAIHVKVREGSVARRPVYVALGVTMEGKRDILGMWMGRGSGGRHRFGSRRSRS